MWAGGMLYFLAQVCEERARWRVEISASYTWNFHVCACPLLATSSIHSVARKGWALTVILSLLPFPSSLCCTPACFIFSFCHPLPLLSHTLFCFLPVLLKVGRFSFPHPVPHAPFLTFSFAHCLFLLFINPRGLLSVPNFISYLRDFCSILMLSVLLFT